MDRTDARISPLVAESANWDSYVQSLRCINRHFLSSPDYFDTLLEACLGCEATLSRSTSIFRARIMPLARADDTTPLPWDDIGSPPPEMALSGRLNPEGIAYFYTALAADTAIAEVRPWKGARLTVGRFELLQNLRIIDLRTNTTMPKALSSLQWASFMLGRPVHSEDRFGYLGMQYLAEAIKAKGFDGVFYDSALHTTGTNLALFSDQQVGRGSRELREVVGVSYLSVVLQAALVG